VPDVLGVLRQALSARYVIERELGHGATATVYLAQDLKHPRKVALKVLNPELALAVRTERFVREIAIASRLTHPHILAMFDSGAVAGLLYYVMPHMEGETLSDRLAREGPLPIGEALRIAREVADALDYAHRHGVIHRDIKPANILLSGDHAWVADFGIARAIAGDDARVTDTGVPLGTPAYMSPEQASGSGELDGRTDIYSLGGVLYEMLTGAPPFSGPTVQSVLVQHLLEPAPSARKARADVPADLNRIVERALAKDAGDRFATAADFADALTLRRPVPRPPRERMRRVVGVSLGILLVAGVVSAAWAVLGNGLRRSPRLDRATPAVSVPPEPNRIAVLYFDDLSLDGHLAHIAAGLTHDLIDALANVRDLRVISPEGVKPYRNVAVRLDSTALVLGVGTIVSGSVAGVGSRVRVSIRMVDPMSGIQLLSHTVEGSLRDVFTLQTQMTDELAAGLRQRLGREVQFRQRRAGAGNVAAWEHFQLADRLSDDARALEGLGQLAPALQVWQQADSVLKKAEALDPRWTAPVVARGWIASAVALAPPGSQPSHTVDWLRIAAGHAERALAIRPTDPEALELRGVLRARLMLLGPPDAEDTLVIGAERDLLAATEAQPNLARSWHTLASLYRTRGRFAESQSAARRALDADAYLREAASVFQNLVFAALHLGRFVEARASCDQGLARFPGDPRLRECRLVLLGWQARGSRGIADGWKELAQIEREDSLGMLTPTWAYRRMLVAAILARTGLRDSAAAVIRRTRTDAHARQQLRGLTLLVEAYAHLLLGKRAEALRQIEAGVQTDPRIRFLAAATPWFQALHDDPQFSAAVGSAPPSAP